MPLLHCGIRQPDDPRGVPGFADPPHGGGALLGRTLRVHPTRPRTRRTLVPPPLGRCRPTRLTDDAGTRLPGQLPAL